MKSMASLCTTIVLVLVIHVIVNPNCANAKSKTTDLTLGTATTAGVYYAVGTAMCPIWNDNSDLFRTSAQSTAGSNQNIQLLNNNDIQIAIVQSGVSYQAYNAEGKFDKEFDIRALGFLWPNPYTYIVDPDTPYETVSDMLEDVNDLSIRPGAAGSGTANQGEDGLIGGYDVSLEDFESVEYVGDSEGADFFSDGRVDVIGIAGASPHSARVQIKASRRSGKILDYDSDALERLTDKYPWYYEFTIPANTYDGQEKDVQTFSVANILVSQAKLSNKVVYELLEIMYNNRDKLTEAHKAAEHIKLENALDGITIPLHPGAIEYYEDQGIDVPDELRP